jgi:hypothetical protein
MTKMCVKCGFEISQTKNLDFFAEKHFWCTKINFRVAYDDTNHVFQGFTQCKARRRGRAFENFQNFKIFKFPLSGAPGADFDRILEISQTKAKIFRSRIFDFGAHILFLSSSNMIVTGKPWEKIARDRGKKIQSPKVSRESKFSVDSL